MTTITVEIPADVRDNSETVTDYAFSRHRSPDKGVRTPAQRDRELKDARGHTFRMYDVYTWHDVNQGNRQGWGAGQRCRFDMVVNRDSGGVIALFHTEYFTRVACAEGTWCHSYASVYQVIQTEDGMSDAVPRCDDHAHRFRRAIAGEAGVILHESERLLIGQHD